MWNMILYLKTQAHKSSRKTLYTHQRKISIGRREICRYEENGGRRHGNLPLRSTLSHDVDVRISIATAYTREISRSSLPPLLVHAWMNVQLALTRTSPLPRALLVNAHIYDALSLSLSHSLSLCPSLSLECIHVWPSVCIGAARVATASIIIAIAETMHPARAQGAGDAASAISHRISISRPARLRDACSYLANQFRMASVCRNPSLSPSPSLLLPLSLFSFFCLSLRF